MPAIPEEVDEAIKEGVTIEFLAAPIGFRKEGGLVVAMRAIRMELGEPDDSGRRRPVPTGEQFVVEASVVVVAIGYGPDEGVIQQAEGIATNRARVEVDPQTFETSRPGVFAGGDCVNGADLVVTALADGRRAADAIDGYLETLPKITPSSIVGLSGPKL